LENLFIYHTLDQILLMHDLRERLIRVVHIII